MARPRTQRPAKQGGMPMGLFSGLLLMIVIGWVVIGLLPDDFFARMREGAQAGSIPAITIPQPLVEAGQQLEQVKAEVVGCGRGDEAPNQTVDTLRIKYGCGGFFVRNDQYATWYTVWVYPPVNPGEPPVISERNIRGFRMEPSGSGWDAVWNDNTSPYVGKTDPDFGRTLFHVELDGDGVVLTAAPAVGQLIRKPGTAPASPAPVNWAPDS